MFHRRFVVTVDFCGERVGAFCDGGGILIDGSRELFCRLFLMNDLFAETAQGLLEVSQRLVEFPHLIGQSFILSVQLGDRGRAYFIGMNHFLLFIEPAFHFLQQRDVAFLDGIQNVLLDRLDVSPELIDPGRERGDLRFCLVPISLAFLFLVDQLLRAQPNLSATFFSFSELRLSLSVRRFSSLACCRIRSSCLCCNSFA